jgi:uncharacterized short protein YbdD (DUF466 family)
MRGAAFDRTPEGSAPEVPENLLLYLWGYLKEISGENAYDRYLAVHARTHPDKPPMSRKDFYRKRMDEKYNNPGSRCPC